MDYYLTKKKELTANIHNVTDLKNTLCSGKETRDDLLYDCIYEKF